MLPQDVNFTIGVDEIDDRVWSFASVRTSTAWITPSEMR